MLRILLADGEIRMVGNFKANKYFRNTIKSDNLDNINLQIVSHKKIPSGNHKLSDGTKMSKTVLDEVILRRK